MTWRARTLEGWPIVGWAAIAVGTMAALLLALYGGGEEGVRIMLRATARTSLLLFTAAFVASAAAGLWPVPLTRWMLRNRRYIGVSFAVSHFVHLLAIIAAVRIAGFRLAPAVIVLGSGAYVFVAAMAATSFDRSAAWLGARRWNRLHTVGVYYIWLVFAISYVPRAIFDSAAYAPLALLVLGSLGLRLWARRTPRALSSASASISRLP
jgi:sulfoxide reductase heme-binding subunit YedZ